MFDTPACPRRGVPRARCVGVSARAAKKLLNVRSLQTTNDPWTGLKGGSSLVADVHGLAQLGVKGHEHLWGMIGGAVVSVCMQGRRRRASWRHGERVHARQGSQGMCTETAGPSALVSAPW